MDFKFYISGTYSLFLLEEIQNNMATRLDGILEKIWTGEELMEMLMGVFDKH